MIDPNKICFHCMTPLTGESAICPICGADIDALENQSNQLPVGSILAGKYLVGCVLGQGGFGITYIGWDMNLDVKIAIKEYYPEGFVGRDTVTQCSVLPYTGDKSAYFFAGREKFVNEAKVLARFSTEPGVVSVRDYFHENGTAYIVMDYLEGTTLKALAKSRGGKLPASEVLSMLYPVMDTLSRIHKAGLLHRDIAPDNIILQPNGQAVLLDFGAARQISAMGEHSNTINVKHGFAPEEQYRTRGEQGPWSDVYALCATIYWLTTGKTPPQANDRLAGDDELIPPRQLGADITPAQENALMQGLSVHGARRQQSMTQLGNELRNTGKGVCDPVLDVSPRRKVTSVPIVLLFGLLAACLLLLFFAVRNNLLPPEARPSLTVSVAADAAEHKIAEQPADSDAVSDALEQVKPTPAATAALVSMTESPVQHVEISQPESVSITNFYGEFLKTISVHEHYWAFKSGDELFRIGNTIYQDGVGLYLETTAYNSMQEGGMGNSRVTYYIDGSYERFCFDLGAQNGDSKYYGGKSGMACIQIYADDIEVYDSGFFDYATILNNQNVDISGANSITIYLIIRRGSSTTMNVVLGNARLER